MVLQEETDHLEQMLQKQAVAIVKHVGKEGLEEHGEEEKDPLERRLRVHEEEDSDHIVHSLPVGHLVLCAVR